jgi:polar amino acid transport system permease protein
VRGFVFFYTWIFRATPTLLQLLFIWDALPQVWGVFRESWFTAFLAAAIALSLNEAAYMAEIIRSPSIPARSSPAAPSACRGGGSCDG